MPNYKYNIVREVESLFDVRYQKAVTLKTMEDLPRTASVEEYCAPTRRNQGREGECSAESFANVMTISWKKVHAVRKIFSSQFFYEVERFLQGDPTQDTGARLRVAEWAALKVGICEEAMDPDVPQDFLVQLTDAMIADAAKHRIAKGYHAPTLLEILNAIANGLPVQIGVEVYESFESPSASATGHIPVPNPQTEKFLGGHAIVAVAYDLNAGWVKFENSWGDAWGDHGFGYLPLEFFAHFLMSGRVYELAA